MGKKMKGDLDKDGKMSSYETARSNAIQKAMSERKTAKKGINSQPALNVEGTAVFTSNSTPKTSKPSGIAKSTKVRLYPGEVVDSGDE